MHDAFTTPDLVSMAVGAVALVLAAYQGTIVARYRKHDRALARAAELCDELDRDEDYGALGMAKDQMLEARHEVANAAAAIAQVNAHIARALAWPGERDKMPSTRSSLEAALECVRAAGEDLQAAIIRLRLAGEGEQ